MNDWIFTPYNKDVDMALDWLCGTDTKEAIDIIVNYIKELEEIIYGYTE